MLRSGAQLSQEETGGEMVFENFRVQIALIMDEIAKNPDDAHALQESLREKLFEMQALGLPLPEDLVSLERFLEDDFETPEKSGQPSEVEPPTET
jgi:hypothetical protein